MPGATDPVDEQDGRAQDGRAQDGQHEQAEQPPDPEGRPDLEWDQVPDLEDVHEDADDDLGEGAD